jgi:hypothetical protein
MIFSILILLFFQNMLSGQKNEMVLMPAINLLECSNKKVLKLSDLISKSTLVIEPLKPYTNEKANCSINHSDSFKF